jgi:hypothetical protein
MRSVKQNIAAPDIAELRDELRRVGEMLAFLVNAASEGEAGSYTLKQFLARHRLPESQYHKLRRTGRGPRTMRTGSVGVRISHQAELDWIAEREPEAEAAKETGSAVALLVKQRGAPARPKRQSTQTENNRLLEGESAERTKIDRTLGCLNVSPRK